VNVNAMDANAKMNLALGYYGLWLPYRRQVQLVVKLAGSLRTPGNLWETIRAMIIGSSSYGAVAVDNEEILMNGIQVLGIKLRILRQLFHKI
jgi:hypothetical protein